MIAAQSLGRKPDLNLKGMKRQEIPILFHDILNPIVSDEGYYLNAVAVVYMISMKEGQ